MKALTAALAALLLVGCGRHSSSPASDPSATETATYNALVAGLPGFEDNGWVVSRGSNTNQGDSLYFSGLVLYAAPCKDGNPVADALEAQIKTGALVRYPGNKDAVSLDGELGLYRGIAGRIRRCGEADRWKAALTAGNLPAIAPGYDAVRKSVLQNAGIGGGPSEAERLGAEKELMATIVEAQAKHSVGCFRVAFSLSALQTLEDLGGKINPVNKAAFCAESKGLRIETLEHFCGRSDLSSYLDGFQRDVWIYQHQRCPGWETPDAKGDHEPGVDYLVAYMDKQLGL